MFVKTIRTKILFTILFLSATVPFEMQAGFLRSETLKVGSGLVKWLGSNAGNFRNFLKSVSDRNLIGNLKMGYLVGGAVRCFAIGYVTKHAINKLLLSKKVYDFLAEADKERKKLLAKADKQELNTHVNNPLQYYVISLKPEVEKLAREKLRFLGVSDSLVKKIPILGMKIPDNSSSTIRFGITTVSHFNEFFRIPIAILINTEALSKEPLPLFARKFVLLNQVGHVKDTESGKFKAIDNELSGVTADIYSLAILAEEEECFQDLANNLCLLFPRSDPCLSAQELIYYAKQLFDTKQKDLPAYAQEIITDRKTDGYEEKIEGGIEEFKSEMQKFARNKMLLTKVDFLAFLDKERSKLLAKVDQQELYTQGANYPQYYVTSLKPTLEKRAREKLRLLGVSDSLVEKLPILGMKIVDGKGEIKFGKVLWGYNRFFPEFGSIPIAMLFNTKNLSKGSTLGQEFIIFREAAYVKDVDTGYFKAKGKELRGITVDIHALAILAKQEECFQNLANNLYLLSPRSDPCLSTQELIYHAKQLFDSKQKKENLDPSAYAQKTITDRKTNGYAQKIEREIEEF